MHCLLQGGELYVLSLLVDSLRAVKGFHMDKVLILHYVATAPRPYTSSTTPLLPPCPGRRLSADHEPGPRLPWLSLPGLQAGELPPAQVGHLLLMLLLVITTYSSRFTSRELGPMGGRREREPPVKRKRLDMQVAQASSYLLFYSFFCSCCSCCSCRVTG